MDAEKLARIQAHAKVTNHVAMTFEADAEAAAAYIAKRLKDDGIETLAVFHVALQARLENKKKLQEQLEVVKDFMKKAASEKKKLLNKEKKKTEKNSSTGPATPKTPSP